MFPLFNTKVGGTSNNQGNQPNIDPSLFYRKDLNVVINNPNPQLATYVKDPSLITDNSELVNKAFIDNRLTPVINGINNINNKISSLESSGVDLDFVTQITGTGNYNSGNRPFQYNILPSPMGIMSYRINNIIDYSNSVKIPDFIVQMEFYILLILFGYFQCLIMNILDLLKIWIYLEHLLYHISEQYLIIHKH
jgi:hypothetical protein